MSAGFNLNVFHTLRLEPYPGRQIKIIHPSASDGKENCTARIFITHEPTKLSLTGQEQHASKRVTEIRR